MFHFAMCKYCLILINVKLSLYNFFLFYQFPTSLSAIKHKFTIVIIEKNASVCSFCGCFYSCWVPDKISS